MDYYDRVGMCRISGHFLISGIWPGAGYILPDIQYPAEQDIWPDIQPDMWLSLLQACAVEAGNNLRMSNESLSCAVPVANVNNIDCFTLVCPKKSLKSSEQNNPVC